MSPSFDQVLVDVRIDELPRRTVCKVDPSTPLAEVYRRLDEEQAVAILVCEGDELVGIFTERDALYLSISGTTPETPISEVMSRDPITLSKHDKLVAAIHKMAEEGIRHVPVLGDSDEEIGLIGGRDILKMIAEYFPETLLNLPPRLHQKMHRSEGG